MNRPTLMCLVLLSLIASACAERSLPPIYIGNDPNAEFYPHLLPNDVRFDRIEVGQKVVLNSAIVMPPISEDASLTIEFRRSDLEGAFLRGFFFAEDMEETKSHTFGHPGIEPILTAERLILIIHPGVHIHLRSDIMLSPGYKTFINEDVTGTVTSVTGDIFYSADRAKIRKKLKDVFSFIRYSKADLPDVPGVKHERQPDGTYVLTTPPGLALMESYPPKVIEGP